MHRRLTVVICKRSSPLQKNAAKLLPFFELSYKRTLKFSYSLLKYGLCMLNYIKFPVIHILSIN